MSPGRLGLLLLLLIRCASAAQWNLRYFYDNERETMHFTALAFPSANRGIATGVIVDEQGERRPRNVAMITADGGNKWTEIKLEDEPVSLFFLDDSVGWMVTQSGIWKTEESGRTWKRLSKHSRGMLLKVWFLDANHGFAVGQEKTVLETQDGGKKWKPVPAAAEPTGNKDFAVYSEIAFVNSRVGLIIGSAVPPSRRGFNTAGRQVPTMTLELQTNDGGATWKPSAAPLLGEVARLQLRGPQGLVLFAYRRQFELLSQVYRMDTVTGVSVSAYQGKNRRVTDMLMFPGHAYLAAVEPPRLAEEPQLLPGKIHVLESTDLQEWTEMTMDYRTDGAHPLLSGPDAEHVFLATDNGMILRLEP